MELAALQHRGRNDCARRQRLDLQAAWNGHFDLREVSGTCTAHAQTLRRGIPIQNEATEVKKHNAAEQAAKCKATTKRPLL